MIKKEEFVNSIKKTQNVPMPWYSVEKRMPIGAVSSRGQGLTREDWDETLVWMVEEQDMQEPDPVMREKILNYLAEQFPPERPHFIGDTGIKPDLNKRMEHN